MIISGKYIWNRCDYCGQMVRLNKFLIGSAHICISLEEREKLEQQWQQQVIMAQRQQELGNLKFLSNFGKTQQEIMGK